MKKVTLGTASFVVLMAFLLTSCNPITLTSWTNPKENQQIRNVVVWAMFDKLEYQKPFEQYATNYFNSKGLKSIQSLSFIAPGHKFELKELESKFDSLGINRKVMCPRQQWPIPVIIIIITIIIPGDIPCIRPVIMSLLPVDIG